MEDAEDATTNVNIALVPEEEGSSEFRFRNKYDSFSSQIQRSFISGRSSSLFVRARLAMAVHGYLDEHELAKPASLIIVDFDLTSMSQDRRFKYAMIDFTYKPEDPGSPRPKLIAIAPSGYTYIDRTNVSVKNKESIGASISAGVIGVSADASFTWDESKESKDTARAVVAGSMLVGDSRAKHYDSASWVLRENAVTKTGIPTRLQVAMLLERDEKAKEERFMGVISVKTEVDFVSKVVRMFGLSSRGDPIIFDPNKDYGPPNLIDWKNLGKEGLLDGLINISSA